MLVSQIMTRDVLTLSLENEMFAAAEIMQKHCIRHMPVCENGQLRGILSELDVKVWEARREKGSLSSDKVCDYMTRNVHKVIEDDPVSEAVEWLALGHYHALPVENKNGILAGIVTTTDILNAFLTVMKSDSEVISVEK